MSKKRAAKIAARLEARLEAGVITWNQYTTAINKLMYLIGYMDY